MKIIIAIITPVLSYKRLICLYINTKYGLDTNFKKTSLIGQFRHLGKLVEII